MSLLNALLLSTGLAAAGDCPQPVELTTYTCVANATGWFYAQDADDAATLAEDTRIAGELFTRHFGRPPPFGTIVAGGVNAHGVLPVSAVDALRAAGADWVLPWLTADDRQQLVQTQVTKQLRAQRPDASDEQLAALLAQAMAQLPSTASRESVDHGALRHEIGHLLLIATFWPDRTRTSSGHYGGPGPDWLDEVAAVLMETPALADSRRRALTELASANRDRDDGEDQGATNDNARSAGLLSLTDFFASSHPLADIDRHLGSSRPEGTSVRHITGDLARRLAAQGAWYYAQARGAADFLISETGDDRVFGAIARSLANGDGMDDWLQREGAGFGLPSSMAALESRWQIYLEALQQ